MDKNDLVWKLDRNSASKLYVSSNELFPYLKVLNTAMAKALQVSNKETACRNCGRTVAENDYHCKICGTGAPGIYSRCPKCHGINYVYHKYGFALIRALLVTCILGPLGPVFGFIGYNRSECICLDCKQGWFPFQPEEQLGRFNTYYGEEGRMSRQFKRIPDNCYQKAE